MTDVLAVLMILPGIALLSFLLVPSSVANRFVRPVRRLVATVAAAQVVVATIALALWAIGDSTALHTVFCCLDQSCSVNLSVHYDAVSALMFLLVSFVGWVTCQFSIRYLCGEVTQGRYFRWAAVTIGAVSLMVISGNLLMFFVLWVTTSLGLHHLLLHYADRPAAARAAWKKFAISRMGDVALIAALVIVYQAYGTFEFDQVFATIGRAPEPIASQWIGWLIVCGAVTKSAQLPFHSWLPLTMETPTPVSALMHAGVVNAGGYLIVRTSPLVAQAPIALTTLAIIGGATACFAATVMLTQTSVKKSLAYSTIAQMGFMMLQCGLGAFSAAMLHIIAHSLYKAHAFLASGNVIADGKATETNWKLVNPLERRLFAPIRFIAALVLPVVFLSASMALFGIGPSSKPGGYLLGFSLSLAIASWLMRVFAKDSGVALAAGLATAFALTFVYSASFFAIDRFLGGSITRFERSSPDTAAMLVTAVVGFGFVVLFTLQQWMLRARRFPMLDALYVHASNGFYVDSVIRRVFGSVFSA